MKRLGLVLLTGSIFALSALTSCAEAPSGSYAEAPEAVEADTETAAAPQVPQEVAHEAADSNGAGGREGSHGGDSDRSAVSQRPQLIKEAQISLGVDSVEESFEQVRMIVTEQQGDVLSMQDNGDRQRSVTFTLRVPQERLDATLDALTALGEIRNRSISTKDVSNQLVDLQARLSNARKSEEALQEIMSRSGEIADVLEVSRELSTVRQSIETMAAEQKRVQTQVRYSTVNLSLQSAIAATPNKPGFSTQIANSWNEATDSVGNFTTDLLQLGLWLLVYSPYLTILAVGIVLVNKARQSARDSRQS